jgi:hypothetical protein
VANPTLVPGSRKSFSYKLQVTFDLSNRPGFSSVGEDHRLTIQLVSQRRFKSKGKVAVSRKETVGKTILKTIGIKQWLNRR